MNHISIASVSQDSIHVQSQIDIFFVRFRIGTILNCYGIIRRHGHSVRSLTQAIITLPFRRAFSGVWSSIPICLLAKMQLINCLRELPAIGVKYYFALAGALLTTDIHLADEDVIRIYGKRWDIEVFFKMSKQYLKLAKEIQCRDFNALIAHTTIVFMRYMFIVYQCRPASDHRTFGELFYRCCSEVDDISFIEGLYRVLSLAVDQLRNIGSYCEKTASAFF